MARKVRQHRAASPIFSLMPGIYVSGGPITISNGMPNASVYYTTDGSLPTANSTVYSGPITLSSSETLQAFATGPGYVYSNTSSATYAVIPTLAPPDFSVAPGTYNSSQALTLSDTTPYVSIFYTTDGSQPTTGSTQYLGPFTVSSSETVNAIAYLRGNFVAGGTTEFWTTLQSTVASAAYTISLPPAVVPAFSGH
jgi:hypothetical protein